MIGSLTITVDKELEFENSLKDLLEKVESNTSTIKDYNIKHIDHDPETSQICFTTAGKKDTNKKYIDILNLCRKACVEFFFKHFSYISQPEDINIEYDQKSHVMRASIVGIPGTLLKPYYVPVDLKTKLLESIKSDENGRIFIWSAGEDSYRSF
jgi:hypothetical protein